MDRFQREAIWRLSRSLESSASVISTVCRWPSGLNLNYAKDAHIKGAIENVDRTTSAMKELVT